MLEHYREPLLTTRTFAFRVARFAGLSLCLILGALGAGVLGYHTLEQFPWIDALLDASMILGGMGPVDQLHTNAGKVSASAYALSSGTIFLAAVGVLATPIIHRLLHQFHMEAQAGDAEDG